MGMKGHRGKFPCRCCMLCGIRLGTSYYYPLETPIDLPSNLHRPVRNYREMALPYREDLRSLMKIILAASTEELLRESGISH
jgi:hypothetical protein